MMFLAVSEEVSGKQFVNIVTLFFQLAQALILDHEPKDAVQRMRDSYSIVFSLSSLVLTVGLRKRSRHGLNNSRTTLCKHDCQTCQGPTDAAVTEGSTHFQSGHENSTSISGRAVFSRYGARPRFLGVAWLSILEVLTN